jgi:hypothetical protein
MGETGQKFMQAIIAINHLLCSARTAMPVSLFTMRDHASRQKFGKVLPRFIPLARFECPQSATSRVLMFNLDDA